jgi:hypothetical protein
VSLTAAAPGASDAAGIAAHGKVGVVVWWWPGHMAEGCRLPLDSCDRLPLLLTVLWRRGSSVLPVQQGCCAC